MKKVNVVLCLLGMVAMCGSAFGAEWYQNSPSTSWNTSGNWSGYAVPTSSTLVYISEYFAGAGKAAVTVDVPAVCATMDLGYYGNGSLDIQNSLTLSAGQLLYTGVGSGTGTINMNSASGSINAPYIVLGYNGGGVLNMSAGTVNILGAGYLLAGLAGTGQVNMTGGTINADQFYLTNNDYPGTSGALVNLAGGTINTNFLSIGNGAATLNFSGTGKLVLTAGVYVPLDDYLGFINGWMGTKITNAKYTVDGNVITFTAVPEPATLALLGLGGLLLRRRRA